MAGRTLAVTGRTLAVTGRTLVETGRALAMLEGTLVVVGMVVGVGVGDARADTARPPVIDFTGDADGGALGDAHTGPPPDVVRPSLMADRYRGVPGAPAGETIEDPLAVRTGPAPPRAAWLGVRIGAGMFDDSAATARPGLEVGIAGRYRITGDVFTAARVDWSRRGGDAMSMPIVDDVVDVVGASAGLGTTIARSAASGIALALIGQLRGDLRLRDQRDIAPVRRAGLGVAAAAELALPATPFTLGVRYEQGVTELVAGARDRAVLVELGVDLR